MNIFLRLMSVCLLIIIALLMILRRADHRWMVFSAARASGSGFNIYLMSGDDVANITPVEGCGIWPQWSPDGRWISYANYCDDTQRFLRIRRGGSIPPEITNTLNNVVYLSWSSDGQSLVVSRPDGAFLVDMSGDHLLAEGARYAEWSPDGEWVYAHQFGNPDYSLFRIHMKSGRTEELFHSPNTAFSYTWSPDGARMAVKIETEHGDELVITQPDGRDAHSILADPSIPVIFLAIWSPDGEWIAFAGGSYGVGLSLYRVRPDGSDLQRLTDAVPEAEFDELTWSPDSQWLYYVENAFLNPTLIRLRADGSSQSQFDPTPDAEFPPEFGPVTGRDFYPLWLMIVALGMLTVTLIRRRGFQTRFYKGNRP